MAKREPRGQHRVETAEVTNVSDDELLLELESGFLRLDKGQTRRVTAAALAQPKIKALADDGKISVKPGRDE